MKPTRTVRSFAPLVISLACSTAPITGRQELNLVGDSTMNQLGAQTYAQELAKAKPSGDAGANAMVQRVAKRIADAAEANFHPGIGLVLMAKAGYDPSGAVDFWQRMTAYGKGKEPPAFLSDHPSNSDRVAAIQREMPEAKANFVAHR